MTQLCARACVEWGAASLLFHVYPIVNLFSFETIIKTSSAESQRQGNSQKSKAKTATTKKESLARFGHKNAIQWTHPTPKATTIQKINKLQSGIWKKAQIKYSTGAKVYLHMLDCVVVVCEHHSQPQRKQQKQKRKRKHIFWFLMICWIFFFRGANRSLSSFERWFSTAPHYLNFDSFSPNFQECLIRKSMFQVSMVHLNQMRWIQSAPNLSASASAGILYQDKILAFVFNHQQLIAFYFNLI